MTIGLLKEPEGERRVALLPEAVALLIKMNVKVLVEKDAGISAFSSDIEYEKAGASIAAKPDVIIQSEMILKINPPSLVS